MGGYTNTAEGKVIAAAFTDAFNNMVRAVKNYKAQAASGPNGHGSGGSLMIDGISNDPSPADDVPAKKSSSKKRR